ncbi:MAG: hypothetical protein R3E79_02795 [Caldilineaceae bacterium]
MKALLLHFHLRSPLLITELGGGDPNSGIGHPYLPGSTIRGAIINRYLNGQGIDAADPTFRRLFLDGSLCFLNGYLVSSTGARMLPTPFSWQRPKDAQANESAHDWAWGKPTLPSLITQKAWKGVGGFCQRTDQQKIELRQAAMQVNIHIARDDRQRPTSDNATIFRYDALAEGQRFSAAIIGENEADLRTIAQLLPHGSIFNIGRSQSAGYGWVEVHYPPDKTGQPMPQPLDRWIEALVAPSPAGQPQQLIVTLLSDALIQDAQSGAYVADLTPVLGVRHSAAFARLRMAGGFNRKWNLPLPQTQAIAAGSVFVYPYSASLAQKLTSFVEKGMGSRRAEGYGRIAVNWQTGPTVEFAEASGKRPQTQPALTTSRPLAEQMVARLLRVELDRRLLTAITVNPIRRNGLRNSQLARLRVVARHAIEPAQVQQAAQQVQIPYLVNFLQNLKESARGQLQRARIGNQPLYDWLQTLAEKPAHVWLDLQATALPMPTIGGCAAQLTPILAVEYALRLIDGVAQVATREETNE